MRPGFQEFFGKFGLSDVSLKLIACKANAIEDFMIGVRKEPNSVNVLLIDSEGPSTQDLLGQVRRHAHWDNTLDSQIADKQIHFMVQVMESWFLADRQALGAYYGSGFLNNRLPSNPNVELVPKDDVLSGLASATEHIAKGKYHKTRHAPDLLARIDANKVRGAAPSCDRLVSTLREYGAAAQTV